jgi:hypothetical protein
MAHLVLPRAFSAIGPPGVGVGVGRDAARSRIVRINLLVVGALAMGIADLLCTLAYLTSVGMVELNPIARHMIRIGGADQLIMFKLFTMALSSGIIYLIRRHPRAEFCAWASVAIMLCLTVHWVQYNRLVPTMTSEFSLLACHAEDGYLDGWITIPAPQ